MPLFKKSRQKLQPSLCFLISGKIITFQSSSLAWVGPDAGINRYAKDIKTALLAADIIINEWGFKDYRLDIYGALDKSPAYTTTCQEIIATKSLRHQVALKGEANPIQVLEKTVRSSLSLN